MKVRSAAVATALALLAGCSGGDGKATPSASPTLSPTPTASPTPTVLTIGQARARYLALVKPANAAQDSLSKAITAVNARPSRWRLARDAAAKVAVAERAFQAALLNTKWPASVTATAQSLAEEVAGVTVIYRQLGRAKTKAEWDAAVQRWNAYDSEGVSTYVELMRTRLGLPPAS